MNEQSLVKKVTRIKAWLCAKQGITDNHARVWVIAEPWWNGNTTIWWVHGERIKCRLKHPFGYRNRYAY